MEHAGLIQSISEFYDVESMVKSQHGTTFYLVRDRSTGTRLKLTSIEFANSWTLRPGSEEASLNCCSSLTNPGLAKYQGWVKEQSSQALYVKVVNPTNPTILMLLAHNHTFLEDTIWDIATNLVELLVYLHKHHLLVWSGLSPPFVHLTTQNEPVLDNYFASFRFKTLLSEVGDPFLAPEISSIFLSTSKKMPDANYLGKKCPTSTGVDTQFNTNSTPNLNTCVTKLPTLNIESINVNSFTNYGDISTPRNDRNNFATEQGLGCFKSFVTPCLTHQPSPSHVSFAYQGGVPSLSSYSEGVSAELEGIQHMIEVAGLSLSKQFKADVWAMGALLLCLCLGRPLTHRDNCVHLANDLCKDSELGSCLYSYSLCSFIRSCLQIDPVKRPNLSILKERIRIHMAPRLSLPESLRGSFCCHTSESTSCTNQLILTTPRGCIPSSEKFQQRQQLSSERTDNPLIKAAEIGNYDAVKQNIGYLGKTGSAGRTALMFAAGNGHTKCIKPLIKESRIKDQQGLTALMYAVKNRYKDAIPLLVKDEAGMQDDQGFTALMYAAIDNNSETVSILIKKAAGKELKKQNLKGETALMMATQYWNNEVADYLVKEAKIVNVDGSTALMYAARNGNVNYVKLLAPKEAGMKTLNGDRALELALINSHTDCANILSRYELKLHAGETPLLYALKSGNKRLATISTPVYSQGCEFSSTSHLAYAIKSNNAQAVKELLSFELPSVHQPDRSCLDLAIRSGSFQILNIIYSYALEHSLGIYVSQRLGTSITKLMECAISNDVTRISNYLFQLGLTDAYGNTALMHAVRHRNYDAATALVCEATIQNLTGWTPLMVAAAHGDVDLVHELVEHSHGLSTRRKETALMIAVKEGSLPCVRLLAKAEAKKQDTNGTTALMLAAILRNHSIAEVLIPFEAGIQDVNGVTALMIAAQLGDVDMVRLLVNHEATLQTNSDCIDGAGWTAMMYAAREGYSGVISILVAHESSMQMMTGRTALMISAYAHNDSCVELLCTLEKEAQDENGFTALMYAINSKCDSSDSVIKAQVQRCVHLLLHEAHLSDYGDMTPLSLAASVGNLDVIMLITSNSTLRKQLIRTDSQGMTVLMHAALQGHVDCVKELLKYDKAMLDNMVIHLSREKDTAGMTALMYASCNNRPSCVDILLPLECDITSNDGSTALMFAAQEGYIDIVKKLVTGSNELGIVNHNRLTALAVAASGGHTECVRFLYSSCLSRGVSLTTRGFNKLLLAASLNDSDAVRVGINEGEVRRTSPTGFTALMYAAINNSIESVLLLAPYEAKMTTESGITALMLASKMGHVKCVKALAHEEIGMQTVQGWSALMFAAFSNKPECVEPLLKTEFTLKNEDGNTALDLSRIYKAKAANEVLHSYHVSLRLS
ncbi:Kinase, NEK [Giardia lamblia P15]|uniref:Kinase, NEK n=1 Tax=Giardia intestinalis (strain P15) TaxID=658858 RepID=E1F7V3_GIAIA|nr:Kinase, NEK [Giardia lamblia P15]